MKYNGKISIATGYSASSKVWKNKDVSWSRLVKRLTTEFKTNETLKEYNAATKQERGKIKDVGGYVGGYLNNGRRNPSNVIYRQLLTLDLDYAHLDFWEDFKMMYPAAAVLHATHSHTEKNPRFRLIMPLSRECNPSEYVAAARQIAGSLDIELFDNTTFETNRLMFWPSSPADVTFYFETQDGPWVDVDAVLETYADWKDSSLWPVSSRSLKHIKNLSDKQKDPEGKGGVVGAFCRSFTIEEAIEQFLENEYMPADDNRYTYKKGSTAGGLVVYDSKFAYSHHGTDPCGGLLCNAFDLVRIHKFGHLDTEEQKNPVKKISYKEMQSLATKDAKVKKTIALENLNNAKYDFNDDFEEGKEEVTEEDVEWVQELEIDTRGKYLSTATNLNLIFKNDTRFKDCFRLNMFDNKRYVFNSLPWRRIPTPEPMRNVDYSGVRNYMEIHYGVVGGNKIEDSLALTFEQKGFHPVKDFLNSVQWDNRNRLDSLLIDYFGAEDTLYSREAIRKTLVGAVARIFKPGIKFDLVLTLVGAQGTGKSTFISKLGKGWSSDSFSTVNGKEAFEQLQGAWLIEMAELAALRKAEVEAVKHFISKQVDTFRPAYGKTSESYARQCVFFGTTNKNSFLKDPTGNRRFMPIDVRPEHISKSVFNMKEEEIDQIWAEAVVAYKQGEALYLSAEAEALARIEQAHHSATDERVGLILEYLNTELPENWKALDIYARRQFVQGDAPEIKGTEERQFVCIAELWCECLGKDKNDMDRYKTRDINDIMKSLPGWQQIKSTKNFKHYGKQKYYKRIAPLEDELLK